MNPSTSRAAVRSMATLTHATRAANPAARNLLSAAARSPFASRALSSSPRQIGQFPRLQFLNNNKRAFSTTVKMVRRTWLAPLETPFLMRAFLVFRFSYGERCLW